MVFGVFLTLSLTAKTQIFRQRAAGPSEVIFSAIEQKKLNRIWPNFAQGGEEQALMLQPAELQIRKLQPHYIRIDHLFDFPDLDQRLEEIISLGATPFLSLSYFPSDISTNLTDYPTTFDLWKDLIAKTIQRYSGQTGKNYSGIYYEVWNEPDLFGKMTPEQYFNLYQAAVEAADQCQDCQPFKIGGPAITTLKKDWLSSFFSLINQNRVRIDFVSWHSYQTNPQKTLWETNEIIQMTGFTAINPKPELIISEWGSTPENSPLHDSYFDASHTINAVNLLKNTPLDKLFAFELKDGPDPQGKTHWGRWGLLTHQSAGLIPKPRYFAFLYLDKLLNYELTPRQQASEISTIGSTNGRENYAFVFANNRNFGQPLFLKVKDMPPGIYTVNTYLYDKSHQPEAPQTSQIVLNENELNLSISLEPNAISLTELSRISAAVVKFPGMSGQSGDMAAKATSFLPSLVYPVNLQENILSGQISFWAKPNWNENDNQKHTLLETKNKSGQGLTAWIEKDGNQEILRCQIANSQEEIKLPIYPSNNEWGQYTFYFDSPKKILAVKVDEDQATLSLSNYQSIDLDELLYIGSDTRQNNFFEGLIDNLEISLNGKIVYQESFDAD